MTWWSLIFGPPPEVAHVGPGDNLAAAIRELPEGGVVHVRVVVRVPQAITLKPNQVIRTCDCPPDDEVDEEPDGTWV